jgi:GT2 family glycosyltransferase
MKRVAVIIVTHNSQAVLPLCLASLETQTFQPKCIVIVDSGSADTGYLHQYGDVARIKVLFEKNIGFSQANNCGYKAMDQLVDFVLYLNPDAFPEPGSIELAVASLVQNENIGCVSGRLLGFDSKLQRATGAIDSTGVFRKWYGRWHDRGQGEPDNGRYGEQEDIPAACAAFIFCRKTMLGQVALSEHVIFDPDFFLYKEDIELCMRIRKFRWRIVYLPDLKVYHCRGWQSRQQIPYMLRLTAATSELLLYRKHPSPYIVWALVKYALVRWLRL